MGELADWLAKVDQMVKARLAASNDTNIAAWELWNEPDWTWNTAAAAFNAGWVRTYQRGAQPGRRTPIEGPSYSAPGTRAGCQSFLSYAKANNALPDIICWHELGGPRASPPTWPPAWRWKEPRHHPPAHRHRGVRRCPRGRRPGPLVSYIAKFERAGVRSRPGLLERIRHPDDTLVATGGRPTGTWWLYKWYGDMTGAMVPVTPPAGLGARRGGVL